MVRNVAIESRRVDWRQTWGHKHKRGRDAERKSPPGKRGQDWQEDRSWGGGGAEGPGNETEKQSREDDDPPGRTRHGWVEEGQAVRNVQACGQVSKVAWKLSLPRAPMGGGQDTILKTLQWI